MEKNSKFPILHFMSFSGCLVCLKKGNSCILISIGEELLCSCLFIVVLEVSIDVWMETLKIPRRQNEYSFLFRLPLTFTTIFPCFLSLFIGNTRKTANSSHSMCHALSMCTHTHTQPYTSSKIMNYVIG